MDMEVAAYRLGGQDSSQANISENQSRTPKAAREAYRAAAAQSLGVDAAPAGASGTPTDTTANAQPSAPDAAPAHKILAFKSKAPDAPAGWAAGARILYSQSRSDKPKKATRFIPQNPERVLDAPGLIDNYYYNLVDWGSDNRLAVALDKSVYLWNATDGSIDHLCELPENEEHHVTSVSWVPEGHYLAVGTSGADVQLWDVERRRQLRTMRSHSARVSALAWNGSTLTTGSLDSTIVHHDVRIRQHETAHLNAHTQEVCGLRWSPDGTTLASGGNDNLLCLWDASASTPRHTLTHHMAAVKALAWCPWQRGLLASGGGTADRHIRFWNSASGAQVDSVDTGSQVTSLAWSKTHRELVSAHGFSQFQLTVWKYPTLARVAELTGHTARVLQLAVSPDGETVCSAGGDEAFRFWRVWGRDDRSQASSASSSAAASKKKVSGLGKMLR